MAKARKKFSANDEHHFASAQAFPVRRKVCPVEIDQLDPPNPIARLRTVKAGEQISESDEAAIRHLLAVYDHVALDSLKEPIPETVQSLLVLWDFLRRKEVNPPNDTAIVKMMSEQLQCSESTIWRRLRSARDRHGRDPWSTVTPTKT